MTLLSQFGIDAFRSPQDHIIEAAAQGKDLFVLLPTGYGKSLTFQYPAFNAKQGCTLVISPLLALIESQVAVLKKKKFSVVAITSQTTKKQRTEVLGALRAGMPPHKLIYVTPELCCTEAFGEILDVLTARNMLNRVVIDEAHCAVEWAQFRQEYGQLGFLKERWPALPVTALTGTASPDMQTQILRVLKLGGPNFASFAVGVNRPNMHLQVRYIETHDERVEALVHHMQQYQARVDEAIKAGLCAATPYAGCGIIYCRRRSTAEELAHILGKNGVPSHAYHAQLSAKEKKTVLTKWIEGDREYAVIVATVAFGMGIDKPDTRFVVHFELPNNIESFVQQCGRAGRDNRACACTIYFSHHEKNTILNFAGENENVVKSALALVKYCERPQCRHEMLAEYFDGKGTPCGGICDACADPNGVQQSWKKWSATQ